MQNILPKIFSSKNKQFHLELRLRNFEGNSSDLDEPFDRHVTMNFLTTTHAYVGGQTLKDGWEGYATPKHNVGAYSSGWLNEAIEVVTEAKRWLETSGYFEKKSAGKCDEAWDLKEEYINGTGTTGTKG